MLSSTQGPFLLRSRSARKSDDSHERKENVLSNITNNSPQPPNEILLAAAKKKDDTKAKGKNAQASDNNGHPFKVFMPTKRNEKPKKTRRKPSSTASLPPSIVSEAEEKKIRSLSKSRERQAKYMLSKHHLPRINRFMTLEELCEEAKCRGQKESECPKESKESLLEYLVDGSIRIGETKVYKEYVKMLTRLEDERPKLEEKQTRRKLRHERREEANRAALQEVRTYEKANQRKLHTHSFPLVHDHHLAKTESLLHCGRPRTEMAVCHRCNDDLDVQAWLQSSRNVSAWTCEQCDFDVCQTCFIRTMDEQTDLTASSSRETPFTFSEDSSEATLLKVDTDECSQGEIANAANKVTKGYRWDPPTVFKNSIVVPAEKNLSPTGHQCKGFTVWTSFGPSGKYNDEKLVKQFDSTWSTREEAIERSRYIYHWQGEWGTSSNGWCWTVGVASDAEFQQLPNVSLPSNKPPDNETLEGQGSCLVDMEPKDDKQTEWDPTMEFEFSIRNPSVLHKTPKDQHGAGFTVWCSCGFVRYGWDHERKPPDQEFDTTYDTAQEANDRAKYLFYFRNCWGLDPDELVEFEEYGSAKINVSSSEGLNMYSIEPKGMECWTVGVVSNDDFWYLPQSTTQRHIHDDEDPSQENRISPCVKPLSSAASTNQCSI